MRVLHIQKAAGIAGSENHLLMLLPALAARGLKPEMLALADGRDRPGLFIERMRAADVPTRAMRMLSDADPTLLPRLISVIRRGRYDIVHTHLLHADLHGRLAGRLGGARVVTTYHCDDPYHLLPGIRQLDRATVRLCSKVICISEAVRDFVGQEIGVPAWRLRVIYYGLETPAEVGEPAELRGSLGISADEAVVGIVARLTAQKGHADLLDAMGRLADASSHAHLVIVGEGPLRAELENQTAQLGLAGRVHFLGYRPDAHRLMREFDAFVLPSLFEGLGLVLLEAMAAAKPVVATRVSAIPEIVADGETGLLVPPRDSKSLAGAIHELISDPARAREMGRRGRERVERRFTVEKMVEGTLAVYRAVLKD